jgi:hypothetical protein
LPAEALLAAMAPCAPKLRALPVTPTIRATVLAEAPKPTTVGGNPLEPLMFISPPDAVPPIVPFVVVPFVLFPVDPLLPFAVSVEMVCVPDASVDAPPLPPFPPPLVPAVPAAP